MWVYFPVNRLLRALAGLALAWIVPVLAHLVHADVIVLVLLWLGTASLLRIGGTLVDRLVPALAVLAAGVMVFGLVTTVWPWGLAAIPVGGTTLSVLVLVAAVTGRTPRLPRRVLGSDLALLGGGLFAAAVMALPAMRAKGFGDLAYVLAGGDRIRHANLFDAIVRLGGYPSMLPADGSVEPAMLRQYPAGVHYFYAFIDSIVTGGRHGSIFAELDRYWIYAVFGYTMFTVAVAWAARYVAGPQIAGPRRAFLVVAVTAFLSTGYYTVMIWSGYDAQIFSFVILAVLVAVLARAPRSATEWFVAIGLLSVGITFTYTLFVPLAAVGVLAALVTGWGRVKRHWKAAVACAVVFGGIALVQPVVWLVKDFKTDTQLQATGFIQPVPTLLLFGLSAVAGVGMWGVLRRSPRLKVLLAMCAAGWAMTAVMYLYTTATMGSPTYYYHKMPQMLLVLLVIAAAPALAKIRFRWRRPRVAAVALAVAAVLLVGAVPIAKTRYNAAKHLLGSDTSWGQVWASGRIHSGMAAAFAYLDGRGLLTDGVPSVLLYTDSGVQNKQASLVMSMLNRNMGLVADNAYGVKGDDIVGTHAPLTEDSATVKYFTQVTLRQAKAPLRVITNDADVARYVGDFAAANSSLGITVLLLPDLPVSGKPAKDW
ncbi:hypothetical protein Afil01_21910 [Actinorhabdospora filicis]|uniref:Uncharacterized protein n=1 Tax=Actinorhabdospora filicis TaxID=1785913 RepID=A0A9W6SHT7_9ACTN|nr:hypothetical protein Afil01_21910 [Actinorhabdospora filicis]